MKSIKPRRKAGRPQSEHADTGRLISRSAIRVAARGERIADQVYRELRRAILSREITPGTRLREVELAAMMAVSRTPVREAISRLIGDRLVSELKVGGVEVVNTTAELYDVYLIREALECVAGRLAAQRIDEKALKKLEDLTAKKESIHFTNIDARRKANAEFHLALAAASGSARLSNLIAGFREFFLSHGRDRDDLKQAAQGLDDHREIIKALRARNADRVEAVIRNHLKAAYADLIDSEGPKPAKLRRSQ